MCKLKTKLAIWFFTALIINQFHDAYAQKPLRKVIEQTDEIRESQLAYNKLDSIYQKSTMHPDVKLLLLQKLVQRTLEINDYQRLSKYSIEGIELSRSLKQDSAQAHFYKALGISQIYSKKPEQAIETWKKSAEIAKNGKHHFLEATNYNNIGGTLIDLNQYEEAEIYLLKSIELSERNGAPSLRNKVLSLRLLATLYDRTNRDEKAAEIYEKVQVIAYEMADTNLICSNLVFHATLLKDYGKIDDALLKTREALRLIEPYGDKNSLMTTLSLYSYLLSIDGQFEEAYKMMTKLYGLSVEIYTEENQRQINDLETRFKTKELEESKKLSDANSLAEKRKKESYLYLLIAVFAVSLLLFLGFFLISSRRRAQLKIQFQEERLSSIIEGQEQERTRIAKDLHDGIVQDLTVLKMEMMSHDQMPEICSKLDAITKEVREISYQMMPVTLRELGLIKALEELFVRSLSKNNIHVEFQFFNYDERLSEKIEVSVYRICQELINNVIKHANASSVSIVLRKSEKQLTFIFEDNGKGFDLKQAKSGIGMASLNSRIDFLNGKIEFETTENAGTIAFIRIPLN